MKDSRIHWHHRSKQRLGKIPVGTSPGSLIHVGHQRTEKFRLIRYEFDQEGLELTELEHPPSLASCQNEDKTTWLHVTGLHDVARLSSLGEAIGISPLMLEDILFTQSRPKVEKRKNEVFTQLHLVTLESEERLIDRQQLALLLLPGNLLLSFLEAPTEALEPVLERIRTGTGGRIRHMGADYLMWALLDTVVDNYFAVIDYLEDVAGDFEQSLQEDGTRVRAQELYSLKSDVGHLFRLIHPVRDIANSLTRPTTSLLPESSQPFYDDLNDHALQASEMTENLKESVAALRDFYLTMTNLRMGEVMRVLTGFSTIFLPLTFLAGVYGMNFEHMPELAFPWAYPAIWLLFIAMSIGMFVYFRRKKWL